jgi:hypothetical protein
MTKLLETLAALPRMVVIGLALALLLAGFLTVRSCQTASVAKTESKLATGQADAALKSGADAVGAVGDAAARAAQSERLTQENADVIRKAEGADSPVADGARDAGLFALCKRAAYRREPRCVQFTPAP